MTTPLFDRKKRRFLKNNLKPLDGRASWMLLAKTWAQHLQEICTTITPPQTLTNTNHFSKTLVLGWNLYVSFPKMPFPLPLENRNSLRSLVVCADLCPPKLTRSTPATPSGTYEGVEYVVMDEEHWSFASKTFDRIISVMGLHAVNNVEQVLSSVEFSLVDGGVFVALFPGGDHLLHFRHQLLEEESKTSTTVERRCLPMIHVRDGGDLLQRAGFERVFAERWKWTMEGQKTLMDICKMLQACGESNILLKSSTSLSRPLWKRLKTAPINRHKDLETVTLIGYKKSTLKTHTQSKTTQPSQERF